MDRSWRALFSPGLALVLALLAGSQSRALDTSAEQKPLPDTLLVRARDGTPHEHVERLLASHGLHIERQIPRIDVWEVEGNTRMYDTLPAKLCLDPDVLWVEPNGSVHISGVVPNDPFYQVHQEHLRLIGLPEAWVFTTGDARPIAVIDTGVDLDHPDLAAKIWTNADEIPDNDVDDDGNGYVDDVRGWDFVNRDALPQDDHSHGSHVAGIAAAHTDNGEGIAGVAWQSPILPLKVLNNHGDGTFADVAEAIIYAAENGACILNLSLGGEEFSQTLQDAVTYAQSQGCLVVAAAGNSDTQPTPVEYPAALPEVVAVAATTDDDIPAPFSNRGPEVDIAAPGVDILSANNSGFYYFGNGTSMATPHVSGLASLIWSLQPTLTANQITHIITSTARDVHMPGWDPQTGWGRIDAQSATIAAVPQRAYLPAVIHRSFGDPQRVIGTP
jgi:subtilisin family serine protease